MAAFIELTRAYLRSFLREPTAVIFSFAIPVLFVFALGLLFGSTGVERFDVGVAGNGPAAQRLSADLGGIGVLKVHSGDAAHERDQLRKGHRKAVAVVDDAGAVQLYADPADSDAQKTVVPLLRNAVAAESAGAAAAQVQLLPARSQDSRYIDYLVPSILAMSLMQLGLYSAVTVVTQRENKLLRRLGATPLPRSTLVAAQVVQRVIMSVMQAVILIAVGKLFFNVDFTRDLPGLLAFIVLGTLAFTALGFMVGALAPNTESAMPIVQFIALPMLFLSGIFFPVDAAPAVLSPLIRALPLTYLADAVRQSTVNAAAVAPLWADAAILAGWLLVAFAVSVRVFRWE
jgi:ABC-2 type transport system permease protein